jgi:hypothetical protein
VNSVLRQQIGRYLLFSDKRINIPAQIFLDGQVLWEGERKRIADYALRQSVYDAETGKYPKASAVFFEGQITRNKLWEKLPEQVRTQIESDITEKFRLHDGEDSVSLCQTYGNLPCLLQYFVHPELGIEKAIVATISFAS